MRTALSARILRCSSAGMWPIMPEFHDNEEQREKEKLERLGPAMEAALARREPARKAPEDYVIQATAQI